MSSIFVEHPFFLLPRKCKLEQCSRMLFYLKNQSLCWESCFTKLTSNKNDSSQTCKNLTIVAFQVAFMQHRVNGQFIMEGLASSFLFVMGGMGFVLLDQTNKPTTPKLNRILLLSVAFVCIAVSFFMCRVFMRMKLPYVALFSYVISC